MVAMLRQSVRESDTAPTIFDFFLYKAVMFLACTEHVPRARREFSDEWPYHITARCINKDWFRLPIEEVWKIFEDYLFGAYLFYNLKIHAFVLMDNHFHLIATTPDANLNAAMHYLMMSSSREITRMSKRINQTYGGPYHASLIKDDRYYLQVYKYVLRNPVEAGMEEKVEHYKYSTLSVLLGTTKSCIPAADEYLKENLDKKIMWLNEEHGQEAKKKIQLGLRRPVFEIPIDRASRKHREIL